MRAPRILPPGAPDRRAENAVLALLLLATAAAVAFVVLYVTDPDTQLLGLALGGALACLAAASVIASRRLVAQEEVEEELGPRTHPEAQERAAQVVEESGDAVTRRRLLFVAAGGAVGALGAALIVPAASLGPVLGTERLLRSPWRAGRRLVDEHGRSISIAELDVGSFLTAFPEGADPEEAASSIVVVRLRPDELDLPPGRTGWAPQGFVAYSKICTHAACAISLFRYPLFDQTAPKPALVCPCHYSTFDATRGGQVLFGPAGRPLPQLPLRIEEGGTLVAGGGLSAAPGPSWWGVRR